jgi:hypothetical protein
MKARLGNAAAAQSDSKYGHGIFLTCGSGLNPTRNPSPDVIRDYDPNGPSSDKGAMQTYSKVSSQTKLDVIRAGFASL